jgi:hypothetical protein
VLIWHKWKSFARVLSHSMIFEENTAKKSRALLYLFDTLVYKCEVLDF